MNLLARFLQTFRSPERSFRPKSIKIGGADVKRTICCFCSCGCGIKAFVRGDRLISLEGDEQNPINEGTLCSKGAASAELHASSDRVTRPLYREPRARTWREVSWDFALDRIVAKVRAIRAQTWQAEARRTDGLALLGGAINTNEEAYVFRKLAALLGVVAIEHQARI